MALMDEFKEERAQMKNQPFRKRLAYFWEYNKTPVIIITCIVIMLSSMIYQAVTRKDAALWVAMIDCSQNSETAPEYEAKLAETLGIDPNTHVVKLDSSYQVTAAYEVADDSVTEGLSVRVATGEIDVFLSDETFFTGYAMTDAFVDLRTVLTPEQIEKYEDNFYYMDYALIEDEFNSNLNAVDSSIIFEINHRSPEGMEKPVPMGIYVTGTEEFQDNYYFHNGQEVVFGIIYNHCDIDYIMTFLETMTEG